MLLMNVLFHNLSLISLIKIIKRMGTANTLMKRRAVEPNSREFDYDEWRTVKEDVRMGE